LSAPFRPIPPNSSEASPISRLLSPASRDEIEYALPTTVSCAEKVDTNGPLTIFLSITSLKNPAVPRPLSGLKP